MQRGLLLGAGFLFFSLWVVAHAPSVDSVLAQEPPTETPTRVVGTPIPRQTETETLEPTQVIVTDTPLTTNTPLPTDTPRGGASEFIPLLRTPWVVIMVTPTADMHPIPPSLQIQGLAAYRSQAGGLFSPNLAPPPEVDAAIDIFWPWLVGIERAYFEMTGRYAQMLSSHLSTVPADGEHLYPDGWYNHPTDQQYSWQELNAVQFEPLPFAIHIDAYSGIQGQGFTACFRMVMSGQIWRRCQSYGPDVINTAWLEEIQEAAP